uniref:Uncharacterized protein n=1 Tax=Anopheles epiroticus TaxID=199890 RepID=A0A182PPK4_9DIPT
MKAFCFTLTILCIVQSTLAYPKPDFAINGQVSGAATVKSSATSLGDEIVKADDGTVTLNSGYTVLTTVSDALKKIGSDFVVNANPLASALAALADDKSDAFKNIKTTLDELKKALAQLKLDVQKAQTAAGSASPVPSAVIRANIPARTVNAVITQIRNLRARVPLITFIINSSLDNLGLVDVFIVALKDEVQRGTAAYKTSYDAFILNLGAEKSSATQKLSAAAATTVSSLLTDIKSQLDANAKFGSDLEPKLTALSYAFASIATESAKIDTAFITYATNVPKLITNLDTDLATSLCPALQKVSKVQIANAGFSDFCFSKYSPRVYSQVMLTIDAFDVCFEKEINRLMKLAPIIMRIAEQLSYNLADLVENLKVCLAITDSTQQDSCYTTIAPYYGVLETKVKAHIATTVKLLENETKASYNRLGACLFSSLSVTTMSAVDISTDAEGCLTSGPEQHTISRYHLVVAIPRPEFGVNVPVYGSADVSATAKASGTLVQKINLNIFVQLTSGYPLLVTIRTQLINIANAFVTDALAVFNALDALALSTGPLDDAFAAFTKASKDLTDLMASGLSSYLTVLDTKLDKSISTMLSDAFQDVASELATLGGLLEKLKTQLQSAVSAAGGSNEPSKAVLRKFVSPSVTSSIAKSVTSLKAYVPLVTYIIANSVENLKTADEYINASGTAATEAMDAVGTGLEQLETEVQQFSDDTSEITAIIDPVYTLNSDYSSLDLSGIPLIEGQLKQYKTTYTTDLSATITDIKGFYDTYKLAIPGVSDGLADFYSANACSHLVRLVQVQIANGPYADYCYNKYSPRTFALFEHQARDASRCVDLEITRLLKLQDVLLAIAKLLVFNVEDLVAHITICVRAPLSCNTNDVETAFSKVNIAAQSHLKTLKNIVNHETVAGLNRLNACFTTSKFSLLVAIDEMITEINKCASSGPRIARYTSMRLRSFIQVCLLMVMIETRLIAILHTGAVPNPDFGVPASINPVADEVDAEASRLMVEFNAVTNVSVTLVSGTGILNQVQTAVNTIAQQFQNSGVVLAQRLQTLATSNSAMPMQSAFSPVYQAISALHNLSSFTPLLNSISAAIPSGSVVQKFADEFGEMRRELNQLRRALQALERDVQSARQQAGNAPTIAQHIVQANIPAKTQSDVTQALIKLRWRIRSVRFIVRAILLYLRDADEFLRDVFSEANAFGTALSATLLVFGQDVNELNQGAVEYVTQRFGCILEEHNDVLLPITDSLSSISNYASTLQQPLENVLAELAPAALSPRVTQFQQQIDSYVMNAQTLADGFGPFIRMATCKLLRTMILTLIMYGPNNEYCFNRFASRVYSLYELQHNAASKCFEAELERLATVGQFLRHGVDVLLYEVEDVSHDVAVCVNLPSGSDASCAQQDVSSVPSPDFGVDGKIAGSIQARTIATETGESFDAIDFKTITLKSHYTVLKTLQTQLTTIGNGIATTGQELTGKLEVLAPSKDSMPQVYDDVTTAIGKLRTLLETGLAAQKTAIEQLVGTYINDMLADASRQLLGTLTRLTTQLDLIKNGVNSAVSAYESSTIPDAFLRRYVSPKVVYELLRALHDLKSDLPLVTFIIELTLGHLSTADAFLLEFMENVNGKVVETILHYDSLKQEMSDSIFTVSEAIVAPLKTSYETQLNDFAFINSDLAAMPSYEQSLKPVLEAYESLLGDDNSLLIPTKVEQIYKDYLQNVVTLDDYLDRFYNEKLCAPTKAIINVLIASGPWAEYCFSKYSPRLLGLVSANSNRFLMCYQIEAGRLADIVTIVDRLIVQMVYDIEDLAAHIVACFNRLEDGSDCIASIAPDYSDLIANLKLKGDDVLRLLTVQTKASFNRAAACVAAGKCEFVASAETYVNDIKLCEEKGPKANRPEIIHVPPAYFQCKFFTFLHECSVSTTMLIKSVLLPVLVLLGVLQHTEADPHPDFGIKATISSTSNVLRAVGRISTSFGEIDKLNLPLTSGYTLLDNMKTAILQIGGTIKSDGTAFTAALTALVNDRSNDINTVYERVAQTVTTLRTPMQSGFIQQLAALEKQGPFIKNQLSDAFKSILARLTLFSDALNRMKQGVTAARDAPGNPPNGISSENLARFVPLKLSIDLQEALTRLNADIPLVTFVVEETQRRLSQGDTFIEQMHTEGQTVVGDARTSKEVLQMDVTTIGNNVNDAIRDRVVSVYTEQVQAIEKVQTELQAVSTYTDDLKPALDSLAAELNAGGITALKGDIETRFTAFNTLVDQSVASAESVEQWLVEEICTGLSSVVGVLVALSPNSDFCFSKFSQEIFNQFAVSFYIVSECYDFEVFRLYQLQDLLSLVITMIIYDVEDLGSAITTCAPLKDGAACVTMIGPYYETLANTVRQKKAYILSFIQDETKISLQRLGACIIAAKYTTAISVAATVSNLDTCTITGPSNV